MSSPFPLARIYRTTKQYPPPLVYTISIVSYPNCRRFCRKTTILYKTSKASDNANKQQKSNQTKNTEVFTINVPKPTPRVQYGTGFAPFKGACGRSNISHIFVKLVVLYI